MSRYALTSVIDVAPIISQAGQKESGFPDQRPKPQLRASAPAPIRPVTSLRLTIGPVSKSENRPQQSYAAPADFDPLELSG